MRRTGGTAPIRVVLCVVAALFVALTARAGVAEPASDDCLAKPNSASPAGSHWYYRVDRTANRRCWFLAPERLKVRQAEAPTRPSPAISTPQPNSDTRGADAAGEPISNASASLSTSSAFSLPEAPPLNVAEERRAEDNAASSTGAATGTVADAAVAEHPHEVIGQAAAAPPGTAESASVSVWLELMLAAGLLVLITVVFLMVYRPFGTFGHENRKKSQSPADRGRKTVYRRKPLKPVTVGATTRHTEQIPGLPARKSVNPAQPTNDLEKDLRWLFDRSRRRAA
jgi:hypothetical protein